MNFLLAVLVLCSVPVHASSEKSGLEGITWRLVELGGAPFAPLPGGQDPFILFDSEKKTATGFAGCNHFFGSYRLAGQSLTFGPLGMTRRACPEPESAVESKFQDALAKTTGWSIENGTLRLTADGNVLARFAMSQEERSDADLESLRFRSTVVRSGLITLVGGEYRAPAAPGSASEVVIRLTEFRAFGTVEGEPGGAVIVSTETGGSGTYYELALLFQREKGWVNADTVLLGDRVNVRSLAIDDNAVVVDMTVHGPKDALCCPTLDVIKRFAIQHDHLVEEPAGPTAGRPPISGTVWKSTRTRYDNDETVFPPRPENDTHRFSNDGQSKTNRR